MADASKDASYLFFGMKESLRTRANCGRRMKFEISGLSGLISSHRHCCGHERAPPNTSFTPSSKPRSETMDRYTSMLPSLGPIFFSLFSLFFSAAWAKSSTGNSVLVVLQPDLKRDNFSPSLTAWKVSQNFVPHRRLRYSMCV